jgi:hypothetical protein
VSSFAKIPVAVIHRVSAPCRATRSRYYAQNSARDVLAPPPEPPGSSSSIELAVLPANAERRARFSRMRSTVSTPSLQSYPPVFDPQIFGMLLVSNCSRSGRLQPGGRRSGPGLPDRFRTSLPDQLRVLGSERAGAAEFPAAAVRRVEERVAFVVGMRNDEREPVACAGLRAGSRISPGGWAFSWHSHNFRPRAAQPARPRGGCRRKRCSNWPPRRSAGSRAVRAAQNASGTCRRFVRHPRRRPAAGERRERRRRAPPFQQQRGPVWRQRRPAISRARKRQQNKRQ